MLSSSALASRSDGLAPRRLLAWASNRIMPPNTVEGNVNKKRMGAFHLFDSDASVLASEPGSSVIYFASSVCSRKIARVTVQTFIENLPEEYSLPRPHRKLNLSRRHNSRSRQRGHDWPLGPVGIKFLRDKRTDHPHQLLALRRASVFAEKCINLDVNGFAARRWVRDMPDERLSALNVPRKKPLVPIRTGVNQFRCIRHASTPMLSAKPIEVRRDMRETPRRFRLFQLRHYPIVFALLLSLRDVKVTQRCLRGSGLPATRTASAPSLTCAGFLFAAVEQVEREDPSAAAGISQTGSFSPSLRCRRKEGLAHRILKGDLRGDPNNHWQGSGVDSIQHRAGRFHPAQRIIGPRGVMMGGTAHYDCVKAFSEMDFTRTSRRSTCQCA